MSHITVTLSHMGLSSLQRLNNLNHTTTFNANEHKQGLNTSNDHLRQQELAQKAEKR